jgi:TerC family integral membrane protein
MARGALRSLLLVVLASRSSCLQISFDTLDNSERDAVQTTPRMAKTNHSKAAAHLLTAKTVPKSVSDLKWAEASVLPESRSPGTTEVRPAAPEGPSLAGTMNDWLFLFGVVFAALGLEICVLQQVQLGVFGHIGIIVGWFCAACAYSGVVYVWNGEPAFVLWWVGYLLDWMLNFDNLFVFHIVLKVFKTPVKLHPKAMAFWIFGAVGFRLAFYVGLAQAFNSMKWFQLLCAFFLIYSAVETLKDEGDDVEVHDMTVTRTLKWCLADRLDERYDEEEYSLFNRRTEDGKLCANLLALVVGILWFADIVFAVDSVSAKVVEIHNRYLALSSTVFCMFGMRSMLFLLQEMVNAFELLKYGVAGILMFIGVDLLISPWYEIPAVLDCGLIVCMISLSLVGSVILSHWRSPSDEKCGADEALEPIPR